jgi:hypothetical protein
MHHALCPMPQKGTGMYQIDYLCNLGDLCG